jgi:hypothetical protein
MENNLENIPTNNPFSVPEGYFDESKSRIIQAVFLDRLKTQAPSAGFTTPEHYFSELTEEISAGVAMENLKGLTSSDQYTVPTGYFGQLQNNIIARTSAKQQTPVLKLWHSSLMKYASAACFIILSTTGFYFYQQHTPVLKTAYNDLPTEQMLYDIDEDVIIDHIKDNNLQQAKAPATDVALENYILSNYSQSDIASDL